VGIEGRGRRGQSLQSLDELREKTKEGVSGGKERELPGDSK